MRRKTMQAGTRTRTRMITRMNQTSPTGEDPVARVDVDAYVSYRCLFVSVIL